MRKKITRYLRVNLPLHTFFARIHPERFFLVVALLAGTILVFLTPPFQAPDEINHFYRTWQVSEGQLTGVKKDDRVGGFVPAGVQQVTEQFLFLRHNINAKITPEAIRAEADVRLREDSIVFVDFPNTAIYTPVSYLPQAVAIFVLRQSGCGPFYIFYGARIFTLLVWVFVVFHAIRRLPAFRWLFTLLALLPMSLFANMAVSADMVTNALSFFLFAYILECAASQEGFSRKNFIVFAVLALLLTSAKLVYAPLLLLIFLLPAAKFKSRKHYFMFAGAIFFIAALTAAGWSAIIHGLYTPYSDYNPLYRDGLDLMPGANVKSQLDYIFSHDTFILRAFLRSLDESSEMYIPGYIGTFGWLDTKLPSWLIVLSYAALFFVAVFGDKGNIRFNRKHRFLLFGILFLLLSAVIVSQLLSWEAVGSGRVVALQGRYFIPVFPLLFLLAASVPARPLNFTAPLVIAFVLFSSCMTIRTICLRYYVDPVSETMLIRCGAEEIYWYDYFVTDQPGVYFSNAQTRSKEESRTGMYAMRPDARLPYGAGYPFYNAQQGDRIHAEVWRKGETGDLTIAGNGIYETTSAAVIQENSGWKKLVLDFTVEEDMRGKAVMVYVWNPGETPSWFDDLSIHFVKAK